MISDYALIFGLSMLSVALFAGFIAAACVAKDRRRWVDDLVKIHAADKAIWSMRNKELADDVKMLTREFAEWRGMLNLRRQNRAAKGDGT